MVQLLYTLGESEGYFISCVFEGGGVLRGSKSLKNKDDSGLFVWNNTWFYETARSRLKGYSIPLNVKTLILKPSSCSLWWWFRLTVTWQSWTLYQCTCCCCDCFRSIGGAGGKHLVCKTFTSLSSFCLMLIKLLQFFFLNANNVGGLQWNPLFLKISCWVKNACPLSNKTY